ncbi:hypothetical protein V6N13_029629 [Hibiscus sabdariffa]
MAAATAQQSDIISLRMQWQRLQAHDGHTHPQPEARGSRVPKPSSGDATTTIEEVAQRETEGFPTDLSRKRWLMEESQGSGFAYELMMYAITVKTLETDGDKVVTGALPENKGEGYAEIEKLD